ncbi:hypothetical protein [Treponema sp.]|uniref:hypothetical protein n=1 Tax=Treponema sp. TaxID=166 RepID=UPI00298DF0C8|nr:hypothetical protein [Treponema sp.]MCQ2242490.1 hypothetical protein [Treponema sp.]
MANRRMIAKSVVTQDKFLQMGGGAQVMYFFFCLYADDEGFVDNAYSISRQLPCNFDDLKILIDKGYVIPVDDMLYVVTDWRLHNNIDKAHYTGTRYVDALKKLRIKEDKTYSLAAGVNAYAYILSRGYLPCGEKIKKDVKKISKRAKKELEMNTGRAHDELEKSSERAQKEPQVSEGKDSIGEKSNSNVTNCSVRDFINQHEELKEIDERYDLKLTEFLKQNDMLVDELYSYCEYVYQYIASIHSTVDPKLFYHVSFQEDVLSRYMRRKAKDNHSSQDISIPHWPVKCPACNQYHNTLGVRDDCTLDLSSDYSSEDIDEAIRMNNLSKEEATLECEEALESTKKILHVYGGNNEQIIK